MCAAAGKSKWLRRRGCSRGHGATWDREVNVAKPSAGLRTLVSFLLETDMTAVWHLSLSVGCTREMQRRDRWALYFLMFDILLYAGELEPDAQGLSRYATERSKTVATTPPCLQFPYEKALRFRHEQVNSKLWVQEKSPPFSSSANIIKYRSWAKPVYVLPYGLNERRVRQKTALLITAVKIISLRSVENLSWEDLESSLPWNYLLPSLSPSKAKLKPYREGVTLPRSLSKPEQRILKAENTIWCVKTPVRFQPRIGWAHVS